MSEANWDRIKAVFFDALDLPGDQRTAFLDAECAADANLRREVEALLAEHDREAASDSGSPPRPPIPPDAPAMESPGMRIGAYRLLEQIGEGGFGTVYMAEQEQPVRRRVALKIIKPGMDTRQVVARFEAERQALAMMDHPGIARVLDGGATQSGRPYFVMELVRGVTVGKYCDEHRLPVRDRLQLMVQICRAVQHAHQKGVIHRDLKPSNVLATTTDGRPAIKVIDFGIAKAVCEPLTDRTLFTEFHQMIGTPQYMSPEQASGGLDIDTRSDVYSLGVLFYELLTGTAPLDAHRLRSASREEMQRIIREVDPPRPSTRIDHLRTAANSSADKQDWSGHGRIKTGPVAIGSTTSAALIAEQRGTDAASLIRMIRGELDWIVMKAMEKDRLRRYESAGALADDVQRYLDDEPVAAGPPSSLYRTKKLIQRHRGVFVASSLIFVSLLGGVISAGVGLHRARQALAREAQERTKAEQSEARAKTQAIRGQQVSDFLREMLSGIDPDVAKGRDTTVLRDMMDRASGRLERELAGEPEVQAELFETMGRLYVDIGMFAKAEEMLRRAERLFESVHGARSPERAEVLSVLGRVKQDRSELDAAEKLYDEALAIRIERKGKVSEDAAESHQRMCGLYTLRGNFSKAIEHGRACVDIRRQVLKSGDVRLATAIGDLGNALFNQGEYAEAERVLRESAGLQEKLNPDGTTELATTLGNLGLAYYYRTNIDASEKAIRRSLDIRRRILGEDHPATANSKGSLVLVLHSRGRLTEAEQLVTEQIAAYRKSYGKDAIDLGMPYMNRAFIETALHKVDGALADFDESLRLSRRNLGEEHPRVGMAIGGKIMLLSRQGKFEECEPLARQVLRIQKKVSGSNIFYRLRDQNQLASILVEVAWQQRDGPDRANALKRAVEAEALAREALGWDHSGLPAGHELPLVTRIQLGSALTVQGALADTPKRAIQLFGQAEAPLKEGIDGFLTCKSPNPPAVRAANYAALVKRIIRLYEAWDAVDPHKGHAGQAAAYRARSAAVGQPASAPASQIAP